MVRQVCIALLGLAVFAAAASNGFEQKKSNWHHGKPLRPGSSASTELAAPPQLTKDDVRQIVQEELVAANLIKKPVVVPPTVVDAKEVRAEKRSGKYVITDEEGRSFDYEPNAASYRGIPTTMCSAAQIGGSVTTNQDAFTSQHNTFRTAINNCAYKVVKPVPALANTIKSAAMATQAQSWSDNLKATQTNCGLSHSSQAQRTVTFTLDNGTVVTSQYTGENLYWQSICLSDTDTTGFTNYQSQYCSNGYLYKKATDSWGAGEVASYSNLANGNFPTQTQLNTANSASSTQVGHYTQVVWGSSTVIAGGAAECTSLKNMTWTCSPAGVGQCSSTGTMQVLSRCFSWVVTGRYYKGGNYMNQNPYTGSTVCVPPSG